MQKLEKILPGGTYLIVQRGNGSDALLVEPRNRDYFEKLIAKHLGEVCEVLQVRISTHEFYLLLRFFSKEQLPEKYKKRLHQPLSNLFNSYAKSINKRYGRTGSLFQVRFKRERVS
jgi:hypothetical protein